MYCQCTDACGGKEEWAKETKKMSLGNKWGGNVGRIMQHQVLKREKNCCGESNTKHPHSEQQPLRFIAGIKVTIRVKEKKKLLQPKENRCTQTNQPNQSTNQIIPNSIRQLMRRREEVGWGRDNQKKRKKTKPKKTERRVHCFIK